MLELLAENREKGSLKEIYRTEAGLVLKGFEVKAAKEKNLNLSGAYLKFLGDGPYLIGLKVGRYRHASGQVDERRSRKVLLKKVEIEKISGLLSRKGLVCLPGSVYVKDGLIKVELLVGQPFKKWEKKRKIIEKERDREQERELRSDKG